MCSNFIFSHTILDRCLPYLTRSHYGRLRITSELILHCGGKVEIVLQAKFNGDINAPLSVIPINVSSFSFLRVFIMKMKFRVKYEKVQDLV